MTSIIKDGEDCSDLALNLGSNSTEVDGFYPRMTCMVKGRPHGTYVKVPSLCEVCGNEGTVCAVKDNMIVADMEMCGVCTWGEAAMLDPAAWNR